MKVQGRLAWTIHQPRNRFAAMVEAPGFSPVNTGSIELGFSPGDAGPGPPARGPFACWGGGPGLKPWYAPSQPVTGLKPGASTHVVPPRCEASTFMNTSGWSGGPHEC